MSPDDASSRRSSSSPGATATGKTRLSLELAERVRLASRSSRADSRQVYRGMDIGTAKVTATERARVPHHGLDLVDPDEPFTAADFRRDGPRRPGRDRGARGHVAILVGGTGLYLRAVARGLPLDQAGHDPGLRRSIEARLRGRGPRRRWWRSSGQRAPSLAAATDLRQPAPRRPGPGARHARGRRAAAGADRLSGAHHRGWASNPSRRPRRGPSRSAPVPSSAADCSTRPRRSSTRYPEDLRAFGAMGYREAFDVLAGRRTLDEAIADRRRPHPRVRPPPADLVPRRTRHPVAGADRRHHRPGTPLGVAMMTSMSSQSAERTRAAARMVRYARRRAGLTQRGLAAASGVPQETIARIESATTQPRFDTLARLLDASGFELEVVPRLGDGVDRTLIAQALQRDAAERIEVGYQAARDMEWLRTARRSDGGS